MPEMTAHNTVADGPNGFGPLSDLSDVQGVAEAITGVLGSLFSDREPRGEDDQRYVFAVGADVERGVSGNPELDEVLRETYSGFDDRPRGRWEVEADYTMLVEAAAVLVSSRDRPDSQILRPGGLEILVRDETPHHVLNVPAGKSTVHTFPTADGEYTVTVGSPSADLMLRLALRRSGFDRLAVLDRRRLFEYLIAQEHRRALVEGSVTRVSVLRLLREMADPTLLSLRISGPRATDPAGLERLATAFRVQLAYEGDVVLAPLLEVDRLEEPPSQPRFFRQLHLRAGEFVEAIGHGGALNHNGDRLLGRPTVQDDGELSLRYLRAVAARDPFSAFMGYYQVLEHSMENAWFERLQRRTVAHGGTLERPKDDVRSAASKDVAKVLGVKVDAIKFTERRGLLAVLETYLDLAGFVFDLSRLDGAQDHFSRVHPSFVAAPLLNFSLVPDAAGDVPLIAQATERIYTVRCAVTHSKESGDRYNPYVHDADLGREVPLVRIVAEHIMIPISERI
ncbi:hypothetical protein ACGFOW_24125 [Streptomyces rubiginosohelvolus]|uniref:hypothetical protein n=1 Tax=Streptomyces rubiginosohelvolus TaxID=67362 RepID=UPI000516AD8F